jgi:hypothetical protein
MLSKKPITSFTILGERNSGTHFLQYAMFFNYDIDYSQHTRHFFGHDDAKDFPEEFMDTMIYFCMVREPVEWIDSLFKRLHHIPPENKTSIDAFMNNEWYSIYEKGDEKGQEIMEDRNMISRERYKNIFEMRKIKNDYLMKQVKEKVKHYYFIRYEDLLNDYENTLNKIGTKFRLKRYQGYSKPEFEKVPKYKGTYNLLYAKKPILLSENVQQYIREMVDREQENSIGYLL